MSKLQPVDLTGKDQKRHIRVFLQEELILWNSSLRIEALLFDVGQHPTGSALPQVTIVQIAI